MKRIPLTKGKFAIVDDEDFHYLTRFNWCLESGHPARRIELVNGKTTVVLMSSFIKHKPNGRIFLYKNHNPLDLRKDNMFITTKSPTTHNGKKAQGKSSKYKGVHFNKTSGKWNAKITKDYKEIWIGSFFSEKEAGLVYNKKAKELYGEFAYQNKIK